MNRKLSSKTAVLSVVSIALFGCLVRSLHLLNGDHNYIISADSHFFQWQARGVLSGAAIPLTWHGGLTYPLAYVARAITLVFGLESATALTIAGIALPLIFCISSVILVYAAISRIYGERAGLFSALAWAILGQLVFTQVAGYLDRDGVSMLLVMIGVLAFHFSANWRVRMKGFEIGWMVAALPVLAVELLLYVEWLWVGPVLLLSILAATLVGEAFGALARQLGPILFHEEDPLILAQEVVRQLPGALIRAIASSKWRPLAAVMVVSALLGAWQQVWTVVYRTGLATAVGSTTGTNIVAELQGIGLPDLLGYGPMIIPLLIGLWIASTKRRKGDIIFLSWYGILFLAGVFVARRLFLYSAPAAAVIGGLGLLVLFNRSRVQWSWQGLQYAIVEVRELRRLGASIICALLLLLVVAVPLATSYRIGSNSILAASSDWEQSLAYLKDNAPEDARVISWWDNGYWILNLADRRPVVDNGLYGFDDQRLRDIGLVYCTGESAQIAGVMQKYDAEYVVFSNVEIRILPSITEYGLGVSYGDGQSIPDELEDAVYTRCLSGDFKGDDALEVVYAAPQYDSRNVVILGLA